MISKAQSDEGHAMRRVDFLTDPLRNLSDAAEPVPAERLREAWETSPALRGTVTGDLLRSINKCGTRVQASGLQNFLRSGLSDQQAVGLCRVMLNYTQGVDTGWLADFIAAFPHLAREVSEIRFTCPSRPSVPRDESW